MWNRREFLGAAAATASACLLPRSGRAAGTDPVIVALFLRGAADGLNLVVPQDDPDYYTLRPNVQIPSGSALDVGNGFFGLHPALAPLLPLFNSGDLACLHASGSTDPTRSHFDAQDYMERAAPGDKSILRGWLNRTLGSIADGRAIAGVSLGVGRAVSMAGPAPALAFRSINRFQLLGQYETERRNALELRFATAGNVLGRSMRNAFSAFDDVAQIDPTTSVSYPSSALGSVLRDAAGLIKADLGTRIVTVDTGGWDTHSNEMPRLEGLAGNLAESLAAFHQDLGADANRTLLLAMTEFGRTGEENGAGGTEHGHGGVMFCLGGGIAGGRVILRNDAWPGLAASDLYQERDLQVTTDFRDVFAEILDRHFGVGDPSEMLPNHSVDPARYPGLFS